jgi:hypothetical protein
MKKVLLSIFIILSVGLSAQDITIMDVKNYIKVGNLAGNRKIEFGVKNILEEVAQDKGLDLSPSSKKQIFVELIYMDVLLTKSNMSVFHKDDNAVVIRMKGYVVNDGKKSKEQIVEESATEVSTSTLVISEQGKFNQTNLSTAIKKACNALCNKLLD